MLARFEYDHPAFDAAAVRAQRRRDEISGRDGTSFAGAHGAMAHEDGVQSALHACRALGSSRRGDQRLYEGTLRHRRRSPRHEFAYPVALPYLDLAELDEVFARHPLWSLERPNAVSFRRADFLHPPCCSTPAATVAERTGRRPVGPIRLLAQVRTWGWLFNPLAVYFCLDESGSRVDALVLHVTNTLVARAPRLRDRRGR